MFLFFGDEHPSILPFQYKKVLAMLFFRQNAFLKDKVVDSAACVFCLLGDFRAVLVAYDGIEGGDYAY